MTQMMPMDDPTPERIGRIELVFAQEVALRAVDLGNYLTAFRATYNLALPLFADANPRELLADAELVKETIAGRVRSLSLDQRQALYLPSVDPKDEILIERISYESPAEFTFWGSVGALVVAVIISGGRIEVGPLKADLPPIATGLEALISLFRRS